MKLFHKIRIIFSFYRSFLSLSLFITIWCGYLFHKYGFSILNSLFWFKICTLGLTFYFINEYKSREYFYYQNLGISKLTLWIVTLTFDIVLMILLIIQISHFR